MKLALDPQMYYSISTVYELPDQVARMGYEWMEISPKADFVPFFKHPRIDDAGVRKLKKIAADAGVGIASVLPVQRWSGPGRTSAKPPYAPGNGPFRSPWTSGSP